MLGNVVQSMGSGVEYVRVYVCVGDKQGGVPLRRGPLPTVPVRCLHGEHVKAGVVWQAALGAGLWQIQRLVALRRAARWRGARVGIKLQQVTQGVERGCTSAWAAVSWNTQARGQHSEIIIQQPVLLSSNRALLLHNGAPTAGPQQTRPLGSRPDRAAPTHQKSAPCTSPLLPGPTGSLRSR